MRRGEIAQQRVGMLGEVIGGKDLCIVKVTS